MRTPDLADLRAVRASLGLSQAAMAQALGIAANHWAMVERGERPLTRQLAAAVRLLAQHRRQGQRPRH